MKTPDEIKCWLGERSMFPHETLKRRASLGYIQQLESTISQVSKALCGNEKATHEELLQAVSQVKNRVRDLEYALALMVYQYCNDGDGSVIHKWMTAGEHAFAALGIENYCSVEVVDEMLDRMEESMKEAPTT